VKITVPFDLGAGVIKKTVCGQMNRPHFHHKGNLLNIQKPRIGKDAGRFCFSVQLFHHVPVPLVLLRTAGSPDTEGFQGAAP
jgi:hypothetical protein